MTTYIMVFYMIGPARLDCVMPRGSDRPAEHVTHKSDTIGEVLYTVRDPISCSVKQGTLKHVLVKVRP